MNSHLPHVYTFLKKYLKNTSKIGLVTNEDDLILYPEEIDFFRRGEAEGAEGEKIWRQEG